MQNYSNKVDTNTERNDFPQLYFLSSAQKIKKDTAFVSKFDSIKRNNFFASKYLVLSKAKTDAKTYVPTIFSKHLLVAKDKPTEVQNNNMSDWLLLINLLGFILFAWVVTSFRKRMKQIFNSLFTNRALNQLIRDGDLSKEFVLLPLLSIYFLSLSLYILFLFKYYYNIHQSFLFNFYFFLKLLTAILILFGVKIIFIRFISNTFRNYTVTSYYLLNSYISNIIIGFLFLPLLFLYTFSANIISDKILIICAIIIILFNLIRIGRNIISGINYSKFSSLYLFLYLCTIEFLPIIILIKLFNGLVSF